MEPLFSALLPFAESLAGKRGEPFSSVHLLAAVGAAPCQASALLERHAAGPRRVLDFWGRRVDQGTAENQVMLSGRVRDVARKYGANRADATHVLLAVLGDASSPARHLLVQMGIDLSRMRADVVELSQGIVRSPVPGTTRSVSTAETSTAAPHVSSSHNSPGSQASLGLEAKQRKSAPTEERPRPQGTLISVMSGEPVRALRGASEVSKPEPGQIVSLLPASPLIGRSEKPVSAGPVVRSGSRQRISSRQLLEAKVERSEEQKEQGPVSTSTDESKEDRFRLPKDRFPILATIGRNLSLLASEGRLDPVVGRDNEIERALDILAKRQGNSPCLIGAAGVGKTAVARGLAMRLAAAPDEDRLVVEIPVSELLAGTGVRGALAGRLSALKKEVALTGGRVILFFDEMHQLLSGDAAEEIGSDLRLSLSRGELPCISAMNTDDYRRVIERDAGLSRRFSPILIDEPSREDTYRILLAAASRLTRHHRVAYDEEALALAITWSMRYLPGRALPDKAVSVIDLAGARSRRRQKAEVDPEAVAEVIAAEADIPVERLLESDGERMMKLEETLERRVIGHEAHLRKIARILRRNAAGLGSRRPIGTFLLLGPTGVGKTETAKAIAEVLFQSESAMTRIDMAELSEAHAVAKLVGAPPGYVGHDAGGQLTEAVRRRPYQVLLLDEIEKAHPEVLTAFLAVFDEGRMTDSRGRLVDFKNTVIVLTSNLGAKEIQVGRKRKVGFGSTDETEDGGEIEDRVTQAARKALPPELYNRLDEVLCFLPLGRSDVKKIGRKMLEEVALELEAARGIALTVEDAVIDYLLDQGGFDPELGARPLRRTVSRLIEAPLAEAILSSQLCAGDEFVVALVEGTLRFRAVAAEAAE